MPRVRKTRAAMAALAPLLCLLVGCTVHETSKGNGEGKDVTIHTPFGGMRVDTGAKPIDTGLPVYPSSVAEKDKHDESGSVDLRMGFGPWMMRLQVASYATPDPESRVEAYYRKALAQYGEVLTCHGDQPVGEPSRTAGGLACTGDSNPHVQAKLQDNDTELKAGSKRRQHIVGFSTKKGPGTHFALVSVTLPGGDEKPDNAE